jgi:hypothetical protein
MFLLLVAVVDEDLLQLAIVGGVDALIVPVGRLQLLLHRSERAMVVLRLGAEILFRLVESD